ncbi:MAG: hypothetical protein JNK02_01995 [Planctomycetes bacterium]|nr:hypothetical protein [Planctomycetota bacterium]
MRSLLRPVAFLAAILCLTLAASAATLTLKNGSKIQCKVERYDAATKTLFVRTEAGVAAQYTLDQLDARSVYLVNASLVPPDDAQAQFQVANFARDAELFAHAVRRYSQAEKLDPALKPAVEVEMTKLKRAAAAACMRNARAAVARNDRAEAAKWLSTLVEKLPDEPEAKEAAQLLDQHYAQVRSQKMAAADAKASDELKRDAEKVRKRYDEMVEKSKQGLQARGDSQARGLFEGALADGQAVLGELDALAKKHSDPQVQESAAGYRAVVVEQMVDVHLHIASLETVKSDYRGALRAVNKALSLDPKNERALSARARIEEASSQGWRRWI